MTVATEARNASLNDLAELLKEQQARKVDIVAPASTISSKDGVIVVKGAGAAILTEDGVTAADGRYQPTDVFDEGLSQKLKIPRDYLRRMRQERVDLYDANVNGWLAGRKPRYTHGHAVDAQLTRPGVDPDPRSFLIRAFRGDDDDGIARAFLSDSYGILDNLDALTAALQGVKQAGVAVDIDRCDLSERRMYVRVVCPQVSAVAPVLLRNYRSPFTHEQGDANPVVFSGFVISNSETGGGAWSITPRLVVQVCKNGMTVNADAIRGVHLGRQLDEGIIRWSEETKTKQLELMTSRTADVVRTVLDVTYLERKLIEIENKSEAKLSSKADEVVRTVSKRLNFSEETTDMVLQHFMESADLTAGGVMQAVTSTAQVVVSPDLAYEMEGKALDALELASTLARN
jgi:hypothetical protein